MCPQKVLKPAQKRWQLRALQDAYQVNTQRAGVSLGRLFFLAQKHSPKPHMPVTHNFHTPPPFTELDV